MGTQLALTFPWGRFHATPWDKAVNEGIAEWPPSPWRLLRALYSVWKTRCPDLPTEHVASLLTSLAEPPDYVLPEVLTGHTRHYFEDASGKTGLVFDPFTTMPRDEPVVMEWGASLPADQHRALEVLADQLTYLGRAESVCEISIGRAGDASGLRCAPSDRADWSGPLVQLLAPVVPLRMEDLTVRPLDLHKRRMLDPPGARWVPYRLESRNGYPRSEPRMTRLADESKPTVVRFHVDAPALPALEAAVTMGEALRQAAMSRYDGQSATLSGKDGSSKPLEDGHRHAHFLSTDEDDDGLIDHFTVWAPGGLGQDEIAALAQVQVLKGRGFANVSDFRPVRMGLLMVGCEDLLPDFLHGGADGAHHWVSHTPFAPSRHRKRQSVEDFLESEIAQELAHRGTEAAVTDIQILSDRPWLQFRRRRMRAKPEENRYAVGLEVEFDRPVRGPLALGAFSHYGLGLFQPVS